MSVNYLSDEFLAEMTLKVRERVSEERFEHIVSVSKTAEHIAATYGSDEKKARLAGILHDWDKGLNNKAIREKCEKYDITGEVGEWTIAHMPQLLHGPTAAAEFKSRFRRFPKDVINAIRVHTTADIEMSNLDMIIYVADAIEPTRQYPELEELTEMVGSASLFELYRSVYRYWTIKLIERNKVLHPKTIDIWNNLAQRS